MENPCKLITDTFQIVDNHKVYDFNKCLDFIQHQGIEKYGPAFKIDKNDIPILHKLLVYMVKDPNKAAVEHIDLSKGIMLTGPIGCGKTSIMKLIRPFACRFYDYKVKTCREITIDFAKNGYEAINIYTSRKNNQVHLPTYCFDDLGTEQQIKHFGNDCNVMAEILFTRYEDFVENNATTHLTTNLSASEIEIRYGNRLRSRMRNMFNLVSFNTNSVDKR